MDIRLLSLVKSIRLSTLNTCSSGLVRCPIPDILRSNSNYERSKLASLYADIKPTLLVLPASFCGDMNVSSPVAVI